MEQREEFTFDETERAVLVDKLHSIKQSLNKILAHANKEKTTVDDVQRSAYHQMQCNQKDLANAIFSKEQILSKDDQFISEVVANSINETAGALKQTMGTQVREDLQLRAVKETLQRKVDDIDKLVAEVERMTSQQVTTAMKDTFYNDSPTFKAAERVQHKAQASEQKEMSRLSKLVGNRGRRNTTGGALRQRGRSSSPKRRSVQDLKFISEGTADQDKGKNKTKPTSKSETPSSSPVMGGHRGRGGGAKK